MITIQLAKPVMENEEGTNHLWLQIQHPLSGNITDIQVAIRLPEGLLRLKNLNGYPEDESGIIRMGDFAYGKDLVIEMYTQKAVEYERAEILIDISYRDDCNREQKDIRSVPVLLLGEDEEVEWIINEEVAARVKQFRNPLGGHETKSSSDEWRVTIISPPIANLTNECSELEKKYRVDY